MSERIWGALRKNALYKSTYTLLYFTLLTRGVGWWRMYSEDSRCRQHFAECRSPQKARVLWVSQRCCRRHACWRRLIRLAVRFSAFTRHCKSASPSSFHVSLESPSLTRRSQHSQECNDPRRHCFRASWPWRLTFWPRNKRVSRTHRGTFLCQVWWS